MTRPHCRRRSAPLLLAAVALWAGLAADAAAQGNAASDRAALEALYDATGGPGWTDSTNWKTSAPLGEWFGVTTDAAGRVTTLDLPGNGLTGPIPPALGRLANLESLALGFNELTGRIPGELGALTRLWQLHLAGNALIGPIPGELGNLASLEYLSLNANDLTGRIPGELGRLASLRELGLAGNAMTGQIPAELGSLANLESLSLSGNDLTGPVSAELGNLANLKWLYLSGNALTGPVPAVAGESDRPPVAGPQRERPDRPRPGRAGKPGEPRAAGARRQRVDRAGPSRAGKLGESAAADPLAQPPDGKPSPEPDPVVAAHGVGHQRNGGVRARRCRVSGVAGDDRLLGSHVQPPARARGHGSARQALAESGPALGVSMEAYFSDPDDDPLTYAATSSHEGAVTAFASGDTVWLVPGSAGTATVTVTAQDPDGLSATQTMAVTTDASAGPQSDREVLEVLYDSTGGASWTNRRNWKTSAPLGEWHGVTTDAAGRVTGLHLPYNGLTGPIPRELGNLVNLHQSLYLPDNSLTGPIPRELGNLVNLQSLYLDGNDLTGPIPAALGNLVNLERLNLYGNDLTGPVPAALGNLVNLEELGLGENALADPIPGALGNLVNLKSLDLGVNDLTGPIPAALGNLVNLERLNLYGNDLTGPIPDELENLVNLQALDLSYNALTDPIPRELGNLVNLQTLNLGVNDLAGPIPGELENLVALESLVLSYNWGLTGPLPPLGRFPRLERADLLVTQACVPAGWRDRAATVELNAQPCETGTDVTVDVAVFHTPAAREAAGGAAAIAAVIDLMVAETNQAYAESGVHHRLRLVETVRGAVHRDRQFLPGSRPPGESVGRLHGRGARPARQDRGRPRASAVRGGQHRRRREASAVLSASLARFVAA